SLGCVISQPNGWLPLKIKPPPESANPTGIYLIYNKMTKRYLLFLAPRGLKGREGGSVAPAILAGVARV
ncbi:hypothetical protein ACSLNU_06675, partial [Klebsiella variicola]